MTKKELCKLTTEEIIALIFYMGIKMSGAKPSNAKERELQNYYKVLQDKGVIKDWKEAYEKICY